MHPMMNIVISPARQRQPKLFSSRLFAPRPLLWNLKQSHFPFFVMQHQLPFLLASDLHSFTASKEITEELIAAWQKAKEESLAH